MSAGAWVLVIAVVAALTFGVFRTVTDGRFRGSHRLRGVENNRSPVEETQSGSLLAGTPWADRLGERATLLQFSSAFCAPCRVTRRVLDDVASLTPGVAHIEVDAEQHLDVVRRLGVLRTPTTIVLSGDGVEVTRAAGAPTKQQVFAAIGD